MARRPRRERRRLPVVAADRPVTREDCRKIARPCPFVSCRFNLAIEVEDGEVTIMFPDDEGGVDLYRMTDTCALDVADRSRDVLFVPGGEEAAHAEIGRAMGLPVAVVKKIEATAGEKIRRLRFALEDDDGYLDLSRATDSGHNALDYE